jgi:U5 small nuclear ribonucleoprotein component
MKGSLINSVRDFIIRGFRLACLEGPLCGEPMRGVKYILLGAKLSSVSSSRSYGVVVPTSKRCCLSSFLLSSPRFREPMYILQITGPQECFSTVYSILSMRRGHIVKEETISCSPLHCATGCIPVIELFGLEVEIRYNTLGQAFCISYFERWSLLPIQIIL